MKYLVDASALVPLVRRLKERVFEVLEDLAVLDLTLYEVGNALWKESRRTGVAVEPAAAFFEEFFKRVEAVGAKGFLSEILALALKENLTFYDAAYLHAARRLGVKLVSEDKNLLRFEEVISVGDLAQELEAT